jgi:hypothetical protein
LIGERGKFATVFCEKGVKKVSSFWAKTGQSFSFYALFHK